MSDLHSRIQAAADFIANRSPEPVEFGLILGTGLGELADRIVDPVAIPFGEIPHFVESTAISHHGNLVLGRLEDRRVAVMQGRVHYYEGYSMEDITLPVRVMKALGAHSLIMSNAVGGMNPKHQPGDVGVIIDHINLMGDNPLIGANDDRLGPRFPDMSEPYHRGYIALADEVALAAGFALRHFVYAAVAGPNLETAAEYRFLRLIGADTVGMSSVPENLVAVHGGLKVLGISVITDACFPDNLHPAKVEDILRTARDAQPRLEALVTGFLRRAPRA
ncbi:MAG: purine-nucleoside phosphorylase [Candidatus Krumholzibacteriia bacterium]